MTNEEWRPVVGWEGHYSVSNLGRVRSSDRTVRYLRNGVERANRYRGRPIAPTIHEDGYLTLSLCRDGRCVKAAVHRLVAEAFLGPCPEGQEVRHLDGDASNCAVANLRYGTRNENMRDRLEHGRHPMRNRTVCPRSHPLEAPNLVPSALKRGSRHCLACKRAQSDNATRSRSGRPLVDMQTLSDQKYAAITWEAADVPAA